MNHLREIEIPGPAVGVALVFSAHLPLPGARRLGPRARRLEVSEPRVDFAGAIRKGGRADPDARRPWRIQHSGGQG